VLQARLICESAISAVMSLCTEFLKWRHSYKGLALPCVSQLHTYVSPMELLNEFRLNFVFGVYSKTFTANVILVCVVTL